MIKEAIAKGKKFLISAHIRPDGDCLGAGLAIKRFIENSGKNADFLIDSNFPEHYSFMTGSGEVNQKKLDYYDCFIAVDCADDKRLGAYSSYLSSLPSLNIDHHATNNKFASKNLVLNYSSTCEIITEQLIDSEFFDDTIAALLYVGMSTDTGHFAHSNTNSRVLKNASKLLEYNINPYEIVKNLYRSNTIEKTKLISVAINSMRFFDSNKVCFITITKKNLKDCGCQLSDTEGLIDYAVAIKNVDVALCLCEYSSNTYKVSLRSKSTDVSIVASMFGGGGHKQAAGCMVSGFYEDVVDKLLRAVTQCAY